MIWNQTNVQSDFSDSSLGFFVWVLLNVFVSFEYTVWPQFSALFILQFL